MSRIETAGWRDSWNSGTCVSSGGIGGESLRYSDAFLMIQGKLNAGDTACKAVSGWRRQESPVPSGCSRRFGG